VHRSEEQRISREKHQYHFLKSDDENNAVEKHLKDMFGKLDNHLRIARQTILMS